MGELTLAPMDNFVSPQATSWPDKTLSIAGMIEPAFAHAAATLRRLLFLSVRHAKTPRGIAVLPD
jgi:hypothetical protein